MDPSAPVPPLTVPSTPVSVRRVRWAQALGVLAVLTAAVALTGVVPVALVPLGAALLGLASWLWAGRVIDGPMSVDDRGVTLGSGARAMRFERGDIAEMMARSTCAVQILLVAFSRRMCCSRV